MQINSVEVFKLVKIELTWLITGGKRGSVNEGQHAAAWL